MLENVTCFHPDFRLLGPMSDLSLITDHAGKNETPSISRDGTGEMSSLVTFLTQNCLCKKGLSSLNKSLSQRLLFDACLCHKTSFASQRIHKFNVYTPFSVSHFALCLDKTAP